MIKFSPISAFNDNYIWAMHNQTHCVIVDPGSHAEVQAFLIKEGLELSAIIITHWHADHTGGIETLSSAYAIPVFGPDNPQIIGITHTIADGDNIELLGTSIAVLKTPGHTLDHLSFYLSDENALFCGDTLFAGGCGRIFEGDADMLFNSLMRLKALPNNTRIYCAHEYTLSNLRFALEAEPDNISIYERMLDCEKRRHEGLPTLPSLLSDEINTNPFLRTDSASVITQALNQGAASDAANEVFATLRQWKNAF